MSNSALWGKEALIKEITFQHKSFKETIAALNQSNLISLGKENGPQANN
jgi:hypothetical protein